MLLEKYMDTAYNAKQIVVVVEVVDIYSMFVTVFWSKFCMEVGVALWSSMFYMWMGVCVNLFYCENQIIL